VTARVRRSSPPDFACADCGVDRSEYAYMLHRHVWAQYGAGRKMLCIGCLETRVGRPLCAADFNWGIPLNDPHASFKRSARLQSLLERFSRERLTMPANSSHPKPPRPSFSCAHDVPCCALPEFSEIIVHLLQVGFLWLGVNNRGPESGWDTASDFGAPVFGIRQDSSSDCDGGAYFEVGYQGADGTYRFDSVRSMHDARRVTEARIR